MNKLFTSSLACTNYRFLAILSFLFTALALIPPVVKAQTWMVSTVAYVKLGVLDKYNALDGYTATFIVKGERDNQEYLLEKIVPRGGGGIDVLFPSEPTEPEYFKNLKGLAAMPGPGNYTWECRVKGKRVVGGHFSYPETGNDITLISK